MKYSKKPKILCQFCPNFASFWGKNAHLWLKIPNFLQQKAPRINLKAFCATINRPMAERTGFEPAEAVNLARFPSVCLKPLDHLSMRFAYCASK